MALINIVLWATIGFLLSAVGYELDSWQFWCFLGTYWAIDQLGRKRGQVEGIISFLEMTPQEQNTVKRELAEAKENAK